MFSLQSSATKCGFVVFCLVAAFAGCASNETEVRGTSIEAAAAHYESGVAALRRFHYEPARDELRAAVAADSTFALAHLDLGRVWLALGKRETGLWHLRKADELCANAEHATEHERLRISLEIAELDQDTARAADALEQLTRLYPDHPFTLQRRAQIARHEGQFEDAEVLFRKVLDRDPSRVEIHNTLGYLALERGSYEEAVTSLQRYAFYAPDSANPHDSLGEVYLWTGRYHDSTKEYLRALEIDPTFLPSVIGSTDAMTITGQFTSAKKLLNRASELFESRNEWALLQIKQMQILYASELYAEVIEVTSQLAENERFRNEATAAHELWTRSLRCLAYAELNRIHESRTELQIAEQQFDTVSAQLTDRHAAIAEDLALLRAAVRARFAVLANEDPVSSLADLRGLIETSSRQPHRLTTFRAVLVECLLDVGLFEEAVEVASAVLAFNPHHPRTNLSVARAHLQLRDRGTALNHLKAYMESMRYADDDAGRVQEARRLLEKIAPSS